MNVCTQLACNCPFSHSHTSKNTPLSSTVRTIQHLITRTCRRSIWISRVATRDWIVHHWCTSTTPTSCEWSVFDGFPTAEHRPMIWLSTNRYFKIVLWCWENECWSNYIEINLLLLIRRISGKPINSTLLKKRTCNGCLPRAWMSDISSHRPDMNFRFAWNGVAFSQNAWQHYNRQR